MSFKPTFVAVVVPGETTAGDTVKGRPFASIKGAVVSRQGRTDVVRTIVAFGPMAARLASMTQGEPYRIMVQHDGAKLRAICMAPEEPLSVAA